MVCLCICFPGETKVITEKGEKRMDELVLSEKILTLSKKRGEQKWTQFYTWGHRETERVADFVVLTTEDGRELKISGDHLLFLVGEDGTKVAKKANDIRKGDKLYHLGETGELKSLKVQEIRVETFVGVFAPFTMSGDFITNGFLVSCYANISDFEMAHAALAPLRSWYRLRLQKQNEKKANHLGKEGINGYAMSLMKCRDILPPSLQKQMCVI